MKPFKYMLAGVCVYVQTFQPHVGTGHQGGGGSDVGAGHWGGGGSDVGTGHREGVGPRVVSPPRRVWGKLLLPHNFGIEHESPLHDEIICMCMNAIVWKIYNMYSAGLIYFIQPLHYTNFKVVQNAIYTKLYGGRGGGVDKYMHTSGSPATLTELQTKH